MVPYIPVGRGRIRSSALYYYRVDVINVRWCNVAFGKHRTSLGLDGAVGVRARIEASGRTVERWPGSWAVCLVGRPLVSLDMWAVLGPSNLYAPTGRLFAIGLQPFICWTCINYDIAEMPK